MALYLDPVDKLLKLGEIDGFSEWLKAQFVCTSRGFE